MDMSIFLAKTMGLYFLIISLAALINLTTFVAIVDDIIHSPSVHLSMAINILVIGILLVLTHNIWVASWIVMITIISWIILIKGILNLCFPNFAIRMAEYFINSKAAWITGLVIDLIIGLVLCYFGFFAT